MKKLTFLTFLLWPALAFAADKDHPWGDAANKVTDFAISKMNSLIDATSKALPTVTKYAMQVVSLDCMMRMIHLFWTVPLCIGLWYYLKRVWKWADTTCVTSDGMSYCVPIVQGVIAVVFTVINIVTVSDGWRWVCIFRPDLYLIHLAVQKVLGG